MAAIPTHLEERMKRARQDSQTIEKKLQEELDKLKKTCAELQQQTPKKRYKNGNGH